MVGQVKRVKLLWSVTHMLGIVQMEIKLELIEVLVVLVTKLK